MTYYAVIDTNVIVSAMLKWDSIPGAILTFAFNKTIVPVWNEAILQEYQTVLSRPKFHFTEKIIEDVLEELKKNGICVNASLLDIELPDLKDKVFYEVTMENRKEAATYLVTGNIKHFPVKPFIVTPREMIEIIFSKMRDTVNFV